MSHPDVSVVDAHLLVIGSPGALEEYYVGWARQELLNDFHPLMLLLCMVRDTQEAERCDNWKSRSSLDMKSTGREGRRVRSVKGSADRLSVHALLSTFHVCTSALRFLECIALGRLPNGNSSSWDVISCLCVRINSKSAATIGRMRKYQQCYQYCRQMAHTPCLPLARGF